MEFYSEFQEQKYFQIQVGKHTWCTTFWTNGLLKINGNGQDNLKICFGKKKWDLFNLTYTLNSFHVLYLGKAKFSIKKNLGQKTCWVNHSLFKDSGNREKISNVTAHLINSGLC